MSAAPHAAEPHSGSLSAKLNWLRAGVLGANDGIVSTGSLIVGFASAGAEHRAILLAGVAGLVSGALSMAAGGASCARRPPPRFDHQGHTF